MDDFEFFFTGEKAAEILEYFYKDEEKEKFLFGILRLKTS